MRPESLRALGAVPLSEDLAEQLGLIESKRSRLENYRREIPVVVGKLTEVMVDNPGQFALIAAGSMVAAKMALNLVKPRTMGEVIALFVVLQVALPKLGWLAIEKGWITFRVRDDDGNLVPLELTT